MVGRLRAAHARLAVCPAGAPGPLPGIVALHDHGGFKFYGKEKIAEGPDTPPQVIADFWTTYYGGRAWANALAREGFAVLIPDTFLWAPGASRWRPCPSACSI